MGERKSSMGCQLGITLGSLVVGFSRFRSAKPRENMKIPQLVNPTLSPIDTPYWILYIYCSFYGEFLTLAQKR